MTSGWDNCLEENDEWLLKPLQNQLHYKTPLPVQKEVVPTVRRALLSGLPMDVCLTAPTGSGKTLCYLLPMLSMITACRRGVDHTRLRGLILVPTKALGQQVLRELQQLTRGTSINSVSLCGENTAKEDAETLVRTVSVVKGDLNFLTSHELSEIQDEFIEKGYNGEDITYSSSSSSARRNGQNNNNSYYFSRADILIATPQRLLRHLDSTTGLSLSDLRFLVIDEADQVLAGNFANSVAKVVERFEEEQLVKLNNDITTPTVSIGTRRFMQLTYSLHKMLCSATLSSQMTRISEVRLRNCRHFALDSFGSNILREDEGEPLELNLNETKVKKTKRGEGKKGKEENGKNNDDENDDPAAALPISRQQLVRTSFALPPRLQEHVVFVEDWYRHAVLLKLIRSIIANQKAGKLSKPSNQQKEQKEKEESNTSLNNNDTTTITNTVTTNKDEECSDNNNNNESDNENNEEDEKENNDVEYRALGHRRQRRRNNNNNNNISPPEDYPSCEDDAGQRILVFCRSAEEARVLGHFLLSAGVPAIEFTTLASESERRRALLKSSSQSCVVASDALMRGVDVPNVGHVIMYSAPETLSQYVHRAGRTARAMRAGHLHLLLQKNGPSGTLRDGEVAAFKALSAMVARSQPVRYERHFFMFERPPTGPMDNNNNSSTTNTTTITLDKTQELVNEANEYLKKTQSRLEVQWASALETTKNISRNKNSEGKIQEPPIKKERKEG